MAAAQASPSSDISPAQRMHRRRIEAALATLQAPGAQERLGALATHMAAQRLVRARGYAGTPVRQLDPQTLQMALGALLREDWEQGRLIIELVVEGMEPAQVAAEHGVSLPVQVDQLRDAVNSLACRYELLAHGCLSQAPALSVRTARGGKRG